MSVFEKWGWIKRNWPYIIEEATKLGLVFVGGTSLSLILFKGYRASEDIDLYDPNSEGIGTEHEKQCVQTLAKNLKAKGYEIRSADERAIWIGPNIKVEVFNNGTPFERIVKKTIDQTDVLVFDLPAYAEMKMAALLCRSIYDARDLMDLFILKKHGKLELPFPHMECEMIEHNYDERLSDIRNTKKDDLLVFQTQAQIDDIPYEEFEEFKRWLYGWLSKFR